MSAIVYVMANEVPKKEGKDQITYFNELCKYILKRYMNEFNISVDEAYEKIISTGYWDEQNQLGFLKKAATELFLETP